MAFRRVILDASVTLDWFVSDTLRNSSYAQDVLDAIEGRSILPLVPDLWHYEIGSVLIAARRARRITARRLSEALAAEQIAPVHHQHPLDRLGCG